MDLRDEREEANSFTRGQARSETQHHQVASTSKVGESSFPIPTSARSSGSQISSIGRKPSRRVVTGILQYPPGAVSTIVPGLGPDGHPDASKPGPSTKRKKRDRHAAALESIRSFLKGRSSYDGLPVSFRLVVLDTKLVVKPALDVMWQAGESSRLTSDSQDWAVASITIHANVRFIFFLAFVIICQVSSPPHCGSQQQNHHRSLRRQPP